MSLVTVEILEAAVSRTLREAGASESMADATARALVLAEAQGISSHGLARVTQYATHLRNGRAIGQARPIIKGDPAKAAFVVDAGHGLAFEACAIAVTEAIARAQRHGIAIAGVIRSHHCGVLVDHLRAAAAHGMVGIAFANSPSAMPMAGGKRALFGTNPVAAIFPRRSGQAPLMIDLSLSEVARGKLMIAKKEGKPIPTGWALDAQGLPTTDPSAGLEGMMLPLGAASSSKGAMLALMIEILVTAVIGAQFGYEASSFFVDEGNQPGIGQSFILMDTGALAGREHYASRLEELVTMMKMDPEVRLPGERRIRLESTARNEGIEVSPALMKTLSLQP